MAPVWTSWVMVCAMVWQRHCMEWSRQVEQVKFETLNSSMLFRNVALTLRLKTDAGAEPGSGDAADMASLKQDISTMKTNE